MPGVAVEPVGGVVGLLRNTKEGGCPLNDPNQVITPTLHSRCQQSVDYYKGLHYQVLHALQCTVYTYSSTDN